jgi:hypothetical protein
MRRRRADGWTTDYSSFRRQDWGEDMPNADG